MAFLLNWLSLGFLNDRFHGLELLAVQLFEHADRAAGTCPTTAPILPLCSRLRAHAPSSSWTPRRCRQQRWRCPGLGHPFTRFLAAKGCPATRRITRCQ